MATGRPRANVRVIDNPDGTVTRSTNKHGREIDGLSFHAATGRFYTIDPTTGKRRYLGKDLARAIAAVSPSVPMTLQQTDKGVVFAPAQRLPSSLPVPCSQTLSDCWQLYDQWKASQVKPQTLNDLKRQWDRFVGIVGDKPVNQLVRSDFTDYEAWVLKSFKKDGKSAKWYQDCLSAPYSVLSFVSRKSQYPIPEAALIWSRSYDQKPYVPESKNKAPITPAEFKKLLTVAREWAEIDPDAIDATTQAGKARRKTAIDKRREGQQWICVLHVAVQTALDPTDIAKLTWNDVSESIDLPRTKSSWKTGVSEPRAIPLLPETQKALADWKPFSTDSRVFQTAQATPYDANAIAKAFPRLATDAKVKGKTFKCFRNVPGSVMHGSGLAEWMAQAMLGHTPTTVLGKHYAEQPDPKDLLPLVKAIGEAYFGK